MKKKIVSLVMICVLVVSVCSCSRQEGKEAKDAAGVSQDILNASYPEISQIRSICELATLECYYHNVAKSRKEKEEGILHIGEKERVFWIEYSGVAKFGINIAKVNMETNGNEIMITIPKAELLGMSEYSFTDDSYIASEDGINKNPITAQNQTEAIAAAEADIEKMFADDDAMLMRAQDNAKKLIENYIKQLGEISGVDYRIVWQYEENLNEEGEVVEDSEI